MNDESEKAVTGSCFCEQVTFEMQLPTLFCGHCHCSMCRRPHGASYVTWTAVPPAQLKVISGQAHLKTFESSAHGRRQFCGECGTQLFCWHETDDGDAPTHIDVTLASLKSAIDREPDVHFFFDSRAPWTLVNDDLPKLGGDTGTEPLDEN